MRDPQERLSDLEDLVAALRERVSTLEDRLAASVPVVQAATPEHEDEREPAISMADRSLHAPSGGRGTLSLTASIEGGERPLKVRVREPLQPLFDAPPEQLAQVCAALGSPHRIVIVRTLCDGPRTALQLQEVLGMGSSGQLYHHLKELVACGLVTHRRGTYSLAPAKLMWMYLILTMAYHLMPTPQGDDLPVSSDDYEGGAP